MLISITEKKRKENQKRSLRHHNTVCLPKLITKKDVYCIYKQGFSLFLFKSTAFCKILFFIIIIVVSMFSRNPIKFKIITLIQQQQYINVPIASKHSKSLRALEKKEAENLITKTSWNIWQPKKGHDAAIQNNNHLLAAPEYHGSTIAINLTSNKNVNKTVKNISSVYKSSKNQYLNNKKEQYFTTNRKGFLINENILRKQCIYIRRCSKSESRDLTKIINNVANNNKIVYKDDFYDTQRKVVRPKYFRNLARAENPSHYYKNKQLSKMGPEKAQQKKQENSPNISKSNVVAKQKKAVKVFQRRDIYGRKYHKTIQKPKGNTKNDDTDDT